MTVLLVVYILTGQLVISLIPFNSYVACEATRTTIEETLLYVQNGPENERFIIDVTCITNV